MRTYTELMTISSYEERFRYLQLDGVVANETFGFDRYLNQRFYGSPEWRNVRRQVILRDKGLDLGCEGHEIYGQIVVHHMNPITLEELESNPDLLLNPEYLISVSLDTHNALHYGSELSLQKNQIVERKPGDTKLW